MSDDSAISRKPLGPKTQHQPSRALRIALVGNPNCGKSSLFNRLTGLRQRTGNFPGVTVEKYVGHLRLPSGIQAELVDLPGTYSLHPSSQDERVVTEALLGLLPDAEPDVILYVADIKRLDRHLLLLTQLCDLGYPVCVALNFADEASTQPEEKIDEKHLASQFGLDFYPVSARTGLGIESLLQGLDRLVADRPLPPAGRFFNLRADEKRLAEMYATALPKLSPYARVLTLMHASAEHLGADLRQNMDGAAEAINFSTLRAQVGETMQRFDRFLPLLKEATGKDAPETWTDRIDRIVTHPIAGPGVLGLILLLVFQMIFAWASYPMDMIETAFIWAGEQVRTVLPEGLLADFLVDGLISGLAGVLVFLPQIALLFFLIAILEELGYMARAVFLADRLMQRFGMNGRSLVALVSGGACAIPAIMSTRTIANPKERLITILVAPLISCSARIPVYAILIGFAVPATTVLGIFNLRGLAFLGVYVLSVLSALLAGYVFKLLMPDAERSYLMIELPEYRMPVWRNVFITVWHKCRTFIVEAGRIILIISMVLWFAASFGPGSSMDQAEQQAIAQAQSAQMSEDEQADLVANARLEASFAGHMGRAIEPVIAPLGYDWKIGIALISSFAAREVFVGTIATLYAIGSADDEQQIVERMTEAKKADGSAVYSVATAVSLILFYLFAMQCMSTVAVTKRETGGWKWPLVQFGYMTVLAYVAALIAYQVLS